MANHKSTLKYIRSSNTKKLRNKHQLKTCRAFIKKLVKIKKKDEALLLFKKASSMLDKLANKNIIHKNNSSNKKSKLFKLLNLIK